eukprot:CAMPEP_0201901960 /NCGR_PEP_ID=MMETSP0902-20130614/54708_1 /ASSEMBLY_ACC=CAM_ASM_000551 /TAXON_ID=420261 /ORGANISM="Thalassiosira antarctica, Strain CCMP982" /LENGTH=885 /DNA_ID=CAMNT_0048435945 /DNA_START=53 /DNA_END=2708 /DNA_ORIENTATION=-
MPGEHGEMEDVMNPRLPEDADEAPDIVPSLAPGAHLIPETDDSNMAASYTPQMDHGQIPPISRGQHQVELPIVTLRPTPTSMLPPPDNGDDETSTPSLPILEATVVRNEQVYDGVPVEDDDTSPLTGWKKYQRYIFGGVVGLSIGLAVAVGVSFGPNSSANDGENNESVRVVEPPQVSHPNLLILAYTFGPNSSANDGENNESVRVVVASSGQPSQSSHPSLQPSQSSYPSQIPSLRPTFQPSQSAAPSPIPSLHPTLRPSSAPSPIPSSRPSLLPSSSTSPSTSILPTSLPSTSMSPSSSTPPTTFCFGGEINIFTDEYPGETRWTLSRISALEGISSTQVVLEGSPEDEGYHTDEFCLERGQYVFTIYDSFGDGICCGGGEGHYNVTMDGRVILEGGEFGFNQTVSFSIPIPTLQPSQSSAPSQSLRPSFEPSTSFVPSQSSRPSFQPSTSLAPIQIPSLHPSIMPSTSSPPSPYWYSLNWKQQGQAILGEAAGDELGSSMAVSTDGMTMAVGAPGARENEDRPGYVKVYHMEGNGLSWTQLGPNIYGATNGDRLGASVSLSEDGKTLAIGAPGDWSKGDRPGYSRVYYREGDGTGSSWKQLGQDIIGEADGDMSGASVSLSSDGKTLAIGAYANDGNSYVTGHVRVYHMDGIGSSWKQLGQDIDGEADGDNSGYSVSLSSDGKTVAIGALQNDRNGGDAGHVRVYHMEGTGLSWKQLGQDIDGEAAGDQSGGSVSLSSDGKTLAIGAPYNDGNGDDAGHVRVYHMAGTGSSWKQLGQDIDGEAAGDRSGASVSLSADGKTVAIGANGNDGNGASSGHVRVYYMEGDVTGLSWKKLGQDINGEAVADQSGYSVSLSADGKTVAIGSLWNDGNGDRSGQVRVFN